MSATTTTLVRPLAESRPPCLTWAPAWAPTTFGDDAQPPLDLTAASAEDGHPPRPWSSDVEATVVRSRWCARPSPELPDARAWSTSLALALVETLHAQRPIAQLNRWVGDQVLSAIYVHQRRRRADPGRPTSPPRLRSVRIQHPHPEVAEVSAHVMVLGKSMALAFRLEGMGDRWLCTELELGPRPA
ncbi:MAG TPA: Rv3235 family protein [Propionibacteriaceae bacterium]